MLVRTHVFGRLCFKSSDGRKCYEIYTETKVRWDNRICAFVLAVTSLLCRHGLAMDDSGKYHSIGISKKIGAVINDAIPMWPNSLSLLLAPGLRPKHPGNVQL